MRLFVSALFVAGLFVGALSSAHDASAAVLDRLRDSGVLKIGFRQDAAPFSYKNAIGEPAGYTVELCRAVAVALKARLNLEAISIDYVPVSAENRFEQVQAGKVDLHCGAATVTLSRREIVDFSQPVFIDGASVLFRGDGPQTFEQLKGKKVGVRAGTTTEMALWNTLQALSVEAEVVAVTSHDDGLSQLESGAVSAYFADHAILAALALRSKAGDSLRLSKRYFTQEPYALALPRGDSDFRLAVDRALSRIYRSPAIGQIFAKAFGKAQPSDLLKALFVISTLPE
jgi:ABC-type amino acid transport substrate-binding protein